MAMTLAAALTPSMAIVVGWRAVDILEERSRYAIGKLGMEGLGSVQGRNFARNFK
jgi:hypothetical protein